MNQDCTSNINNAQESENNKNENNMHNFDKKTKSYRNLNTHLFQSTNSVENCCNSNATIGTNNCVELSKNPILNKINKNLFN